MTRRCSHCSANGHNSRTCPAAACTGGDGGGAGVRLFGVRLTDGSIIKKSASMGNLSSHYPSLENNHVRGEEEGGERGEDDGGYLSDDPNRASCSSNRRCGERKKGVPWTEEEHRLFLIGLQQLGKGDWRGIARKYVVSRTPTQVASHAQKYFIRQTNATRRKRRSSLFDMVPDMGTEQQLPPEEASLHPLQAREPDNGRSLPSLNLTLGTEPEPMEATTSDEAAKSAESSTIHSDFPPVYPVKESTQSMTMPCNTPPVILPPFFTAYVPIAFPQWQQNLAVVPEGEKTEGSRHEILKPIPIHRKEPVNVDELVGISNLNLNETDNGHVVLPQLSLNLLGPGSRQSAFHASPQGSSSDLTEVANSAIKAV
ncbi:hypothetical protein Droror1_Dr00009890 [Drosera rotundifolia]